VLGVLRNGDGPTVLARADMDALPVAEATGLSYASRQTTTDSDGSTVALMHACGHDVHTAGLVGCAHLLSEGRSSWQGTMIVLFQPSEEDGDGAEAMIADGLVERCPRPDVVLAQHVLPYPSGYVGTRAGSFLSAADSLRITLTGRGAHGSMPQAAIDPVVMAAMCVIRLQTVISRELSATTPAVLTVGSIRAGSGPNIIPDTAELQLNLRTYDDLSRQRSLSAIHRIIEGECAASGAPEPPVFETLSTFPPTVNDEAVTEKIAVAFTDYFGDAAGTIELQTASEDLSEIPKAFDVPYCYWGIGGIDPQQYAAAEQNGTIADDIPVNHSPTFAPVLQPTLDTAVSALVVAALAWLGAEGS
jgi:hippurate hydrolase